MQDEDALSFSIGHSRRVVVLSCCSLRGICPFGHFFSLFNEVSVWAVKVSVWAAKVSVWAAKGTVWAPVYFFSYPFGHFLNFSVW